MLVLLVLLMLLMLLVLLVLLVVYLLVVLCVVVRVPYLLLVSFSFLPHSCHGPTLGQFKMHVPQTIRSRRLLFHPNHVGHTTPCNTILCNRGVVVTLSIETHCPIPFQNESNSGRFAIFNVARFVQ